VKEEATIMTVTQAFIMEQVLGIDVGLGSYKPSPKKEDPEDNDEDGE